MGEGGVAKFFSAQNLTRFSKIYQLNFWKANSNNGYTFLASCHIVLDYLYEYYSFVGKIQF